MAVWLTESGQRVGKLYSHTKEVCCIAFAPDGSRVLSGSEDRSLCVWDVEGAERLPAAANHSSAINGLAFSSSGSRFVSASSDYTLRYGCVLLLTCLLFMGVCRLAWVQEHRACTEWSGSACLCTVTGVQTKWTLTFRFVPQLSYIQNILQSAVSGWQIQIKPCMLCIL